MAGLLSVGECGGGCGRGGGFVADVHGCDEVVVDGEDVEDLGVGE